MALVQAAPLGGADPVAALADEVATVLREHPQVQMVVFPEIHLYGGSDEVADAAAWLDRPPNR